MPGIFSGWKRREPRTGSRAGRRMPARSTTTAPPRSDHLWQWAAGRQRDARTGTTWPQRQPPPCPQQTASPCAAISAADGPEQVVQFFKIDPFQELTIQLGDPVEGIAGPSLGCVPIAAARAALAFQTDFEQRWFLQRLQTGELSASVALAPAETVTLTVRTTQRKQFDQTTVDEVEQVDQQESVTADKEAVNVSRSSSKTNNWTVAGNASYTLGTGNTLGVNASMSETLNETSTSSAQTTRESTQKSASTLKTTHKVQVREATESVYETGSTRRITNPYRDRSLRLDVYALVKQYCVQFHLVRIAPVLVVTVDAMMFDRDFVQRQGPFLLQDLTDRSLEAELVEALQTVAGLPAPGQQGHAHDIALTALDYLFAGPVIFHLPATGALDFNDPGTSFLQTEDLGGSGRGDTSGLTDATANQLGVVLTMLGVFYELYHRKVLTLPEEGPARGELAVELALALDRALAERWIGAEENDHMSNVLDRGSMGEVLRRLAGFLAVTSGVLRPLMQPVEAELADRRERERAEWVISRVVDHLRCHTGFYTQRFLQYCATQTHGRDIAAFVRQLLAGFIEGTTEEAADVLNPAAAYLDGANIIVPLRRQPTHDELVALVKRLDHHDDDQQVELPGGLVDTTTVTVPTDGQHIEPVAGTCVLADTTGGGEQYQPIHVVVEPGS
ncbi:hypothetical protein [Paractinoplanes lichenicola]|nr:hypothetical protein [Actinoplanes lichenicola]